MEADESTKGSPQLKCFSQNHGNNVILLENNTVAYRKASFANAVTVSEQPVLPGEIFLVEIEQTEPGWTGHMRLGLTQLNPTARLPFYSLPDLLNRGDSWICAITKHHNRLRYSENGGGDRRRNRRCTSCFTGGQPAQGNTQPQETSNSSRHTPSSTTLDVASGWEVAQSNGGCLTLDDHSKTTNGLLGLAIDESTHQLCDDISMGTLSKSASDPNGTFTPSCDTLLSCGTARSPPFNWTQVVMPQIENEQPACPASGKMVDLLSLNEEPFVLSASESATRISNSIKESVSQLLEDLALGDDRSPVVANKTTNEPPKGTREFTNGACLSSQADGEVLKRTQTLCATASGSSSLSKSDHKKCTFCPPSWAGGKRVQPDGKFNLNGVLSVPSPASFLEFVDNHRSDKDSEPTDGTNARVCHVNRRNHVEPSEDCVLANSNFDEGNSRTSHINEAVSEVVAMVQEEGETSNEENGGSEEHYVSCLARLAVGDHIRTSRGLVPRSALLSSTPKFLDSALLPLPTDPGSRIGLLYLPQDDNYAEMHYIINGEDQGVFTRLLPYNDAPLHAVVDVYGTTKRVRIIQLYETMSLQAACRAVILQRLVPENIPLLPLPPQLLQYLLASDG